MRIFIKVNGDILLKRGFEFPFQIIDKFRYPTVILIVFLAVADEDVVFVAWYYGWHGFSDVRKS
jgi:hypothetical protein